MKIDRRKKYVIGIDTETCNGHTDDNGKLCLTDSLVYDIGWAVTDKKGKIYRTRSFVIYETFVGMKDVMKSAYYANKIPQYEKDLKNGKRKLVTLETARRFLVNDMQEFHTNIVFAHNAYFDLNALNKTERYITKSKYRYFFPYDTIVWDTLKMSRDIFKNKKMYNTWCEENGYMTKHKKPQVRLTAEIIYRYISGEHNFDENHTGLEDAKIETQIFAYCMRQHKKMRKALFSASPE